jgi:transcriptional regulator with XRE-family HTH domain
MPTRDPRKVALGARIRELREKAEMSRADLATAAGVSVRAIVQWELGEREPSWGNVQALGEALGVECTAFNAAPGSTARRPRGRPRKTEATPKGTTKRKQ